MTTITDDGDDVLLPDPEDRQWLVTQLAELVAARGYQQLVLSPLVEPNETYFPDPWQGGQVSLARLARRLMHYAALDDLDVGVTLFEDDEQLTGSRGPRPQDLGVWFAGMSGGAAGFEAYLPLLEDPKDVVAAMSRAVAAAFRQHHGLSAPDTATAERLIDVTSIYLGFGVLTTDAALRHQAKGAGGFTSARSQTRLGVVSPRAMAFTLAASAVARGLDARARRSVVRNLQSNPAGFFKRGVELLSRVDPPVRQILGVPPQETWPAARDLTELTAPLPDDGVAERPTSGKDPDSVVGMNAGKPVFMVERSMGLRLAKLFGLPVALLGVVATRTAPDLGIGMSQVLGAAAALGLTGLTIGSFFTDRRCSEPKCGAALRPGAQVCPRCAGEIAGSIAHPRDRLAAEEALAQGGREHPSAIDAAARGTAQPSTDSAEGSIVQRD